MSPRRTPLGPGFVLVLALLMGGWFLQRGVAQEQNVYVQARLFQEIVDHIADRYVEEVDRNILYRHAIDGLIGELGDPNTSLLDRDEYENFRIRTEGDYGGVGLEITERDGYVTVVSPLPGTPGTRAGIRPGDRIVGVDGESAVGWSVQRAVQVLRGPPDTEVDVRIERPGVDEPIEFTLSREQIQIRSVPFALLLDGGVGYIPLDLFSETSTEEVRAAADSLREEGARSLILDLRGNPGGVLDQGVGVTDLFLDRGDDVVETRGQGERRQGVLRARSGERFEGLPVVVLVDRGSASASEIVAGALQDHDRALVLGSSTFGKGSVQSLFSLTDGHVLKLTTARWYTPRGRSIERVRTDPDEEGTAADFPPDDPESFGITLTGRYAFPPDTAGRPTVTSVGGRTLYGGGGIVPDLLISPDTLTTEERRAVRELDRRAGAFSTAVFHYAVEYLARHGEPDPEFRLSPDEMEAFHRHLEEEVGVAPDVLRTAERFVRFQLESEIANQGLGPAGAFRHQFPHDAPVRRAVELLRGADSREALFLLAGSSFAETPEEEDPATPEEEPEDGRPDTP